MAQSASAPQTPIGQQIPFGYQMGGQQQPLTPAFPNDQQPLWNEQQLLYNQQPLDTLPSHGYVPQSFACEPSCYSSTPQFPPGQQFHSALVTPASSQGVYTDSHGVTYDYDGDDEGDWGQNHMEDEQYGGFINDDAQVSAGALGDAPKDLVHDPIYQQTIQHVSALREQFNTSPKNGAIPVPVLQPVPLKHKRGLEYAGDLEFDDYEFEEAVHEAKKRRIGPDPETFFGNAQKVFTGAVVPARPFLPEARKDGPEFNGLDLDLQILGLGPEFEGAHDGATLSLARPRRSYGLQPPLAPPKARNPTFRLFESACSSFWLMIEITKHLRVKDLVNLYSVSRTFHGFVNSRFQSTIAAWAQHMSPAGWKVFYWKFYGKYTIPDPSGLTWAAPGPVAFPRPVWDVKPRLASNKNIRRVPSLRYLAMLEQRETRTRDILACLARAGHRLPETAHVTLKKIWLLMDCATNAQRRGFVHNPDLWTVHDLYNAQMFFVKLHMRFNEPGFGPDSPLLADTLLGARDGLTPLWKLLRRKAYTDPVEVIQQRLRYWAPDEDVDHWRLLGGSGKAYWDVPPGELGEEHREGWGAGNLHMMRPDELVVEECVRREIDMQQHLVFMVFWGHVDFQKRRNLVPTEEEMYMSDEDELPLPAYGPFGRTGTFGKCGNVPFDYDNWQPKHAMKARWKTLTRAEKLWVVKDDSREQEDALVYEEDGDGFWNDFNVNDYPDPEEEDRQEALRQNKPHLNHLERKVLDNYHEKKAQDEAIDYTDLVSLSGSSNSFFAPVVETGEPELDPAYSRAKMEEEARKGQEEQAPIEYVYKDDEIPPIPANVTDPVTIAHWDDMDPYLHKVIIEKDQRLELQHRREKRTLLFLQRQEEKEKKREEEEEKRGELVHLASLPTHRYHYDYPSITDPHLLSLLRRYDQFPPEAFGDQFPSSPEKKPHEDPRREDWEEADDQGLRALGDVDYDSEELDFDVDVYQKFLDRVGDDGGVRRRAISQGVTAAAANGSGGDGGDDKHKGTGNDEECREEEDDDDTTMAHEADVLEADDDIPFPKYEFRHF